MKKTNGKNKGNTFERKISNILSERFSEFLGIEKPFRRNSDSGSFFGGTNLTRTTQYDTETACFGDILCPKNFVFSIECKHYKTSPTFQSIIKKDVAQWDDWIKQVDQDSTASGKEPLLIVKYNNVPEIIFTKIKLNEPEVFCYSGFYVYSLTTLLASPDSLFFTSK